MKATAIMGAGGHAKVIIDILMAAKEEIYGIYVSNGDEIGSHVCDFPVLSENDFQASSEECDIIVAIGDNALREKIYERYLSQGYTAKTLIHPTACIAPSAKIGKGTVVMANAVIQSGVKIGHNAIVNTACIIEHECNIGQHSHIGPGAVLCGNVVVEKNGFIGANSTLIPGVTIKQSSVVGAGSVVLSEVSESLVVVGNPAKKVKEIGEK